MGIKTRKKPSVDDSFLWRICHALDIHPTDLATAIDVHYKRDLQPLLKGGRADLPEIDRDDTWWRIKDFVSKRLGDLLAVNYELDKALQADRTARALRMERFNKSVRGK